MQPFQFVAKPGASFTSDIEIFLAFAIGVSVEEVKWGGDQEAGVYQTT